MEQVLTRINELIKVELSRRGLDARRCYTSVAPMPPDGTRVLVECSDPELLAAIKAEVDSGKEGIVWQQMPAEPQPVLIGASSVADIRKTPTHTAELVTQFIYGDELEVLKDTGEWLLIRMDDGYLGWVRSWHVTEIDSAALATYRDAVSHRIARNHAEVREGPSSDALPVTDLVVGTNVVTTDCDKRGWRGIALPDGKSGYIKSRSLEAVPPARPISRERLSATGLRFLGIPYIWGGTTPKGFDCSGLIQRIYRLNAHLIPRDADLQSLYGEPLPAGDLDALRTGDLLFFGANEKRITHVAMMLSDGLILHAYGQVKVGSLDARHPLYDAKLHRDWRLSRNPIPAG